MKTPFPLIALLAAALMTGGCASYYNDFMHPMRIDTRTADGTPVAGASCRLRNDKTELNSKSGDTVGVRRSRAPLQITCSSPLQPDAVAEARPTMQTARIVNLVHGVRGMFESGGGSAYAYPSWVQLVFGQTLVFDRGDQSDPAQPTPPRR